MPEATLTAAAPPCPGDARAARGVAFRWSEVTASVADMGTFLPLAIGVSLVCGSNFAIVLAGAGLANIYGGWRFRQPIPVQPMKALCAIAIAASWTSGQLAASGLIMGLLLLLFTYSGLVTWVSRIVPKTAVRAVQLAAAVLLTIKAAAWIVALPAVSPASPWQAPLVGWSGLLLASVALLAMCHPRSRGGWAVLAVFTAGVAFACLAGPDARPAAVATPWPPFVLPHGMPEWRQVIGGVLPQLPLTLLNSVLAVCALSEQYFPGRGVPPRQMAANVGWINVVLPLAGAMPMCHGSGGLAAIHRCGGRSAAAPVALGLTMLLCGLCFSGSTMTVLSHFPKGLLAAMLVTTSVSLGTTALRPLYRRPSVLVACLTITALLVIVQC